MGERLRIRTGLTSYADVVFVGSKITPRRIRNLIKSLSLQADILEEDELTGEVFDQYRQALSIAPEGGS